LGDKGIIWVDVFRFELFLSLGIIPAFREDHGRINTAVRRTRRYAGGATYFL
jgi:hypothetical protein